MTLRLAAQEWMLEGETLEEKYAFARSVGFDGIELSARGGGVLEGTAEKLRAAAAAGVVMPSAVVLPTAFLGDLDPQRRAIAIDELAGFLRVLPEAGALGVVCPNSFGVASEVLPPFGPPRPPETSRQLLAHALSEALAASPGGAAVYLEPLNRYEDYLVHTLDDAAGILDLVGDDRLRIVADTFHMSIEEPNIGDALRRCGSRLAHVQLGDTNRLEPGAGHYDWGQTLAALADIGYRGWLALECGLSGPPAEVLPRVAELLKT